MLGLVILATILAGMAYFIRFLAHLEILWVFVPEQTYALVTTKKNESGRMTKGGGNVVNVIHAVPGKKLMKKGSRMDWYFTRGWQPRGLLFYILGVTWIGPFRYLRTNTTHRFRYGKKKGVQTRTDEGELFRDYEVTDDDMITKFVPFSGEQAVWVTDAESNEVFQLNFLFNIVEESTYPLRVVTRVADANAILAGMIKEKVNAITGSAPPVRFLKATADSTQAILDAAREATAESERAVGKHIDTINLIATDMDKEDRELYELPARTEINNKAELAQADKDAGVRIKAATAAKTAQLLANDADADRIERVVKPAAETDRTVAVRIAEAVEKNQNLTSITYAPGANTMVPLQK